MTGMLARKPPPQPMNPSRQLARTVLRAVYWDSFAIGVATFAQTPRASASRHKLQRHGDR